MKHRKMFMSAWTLQLAGLLVFPGFEVRGLAMGLIIGYWPVYVSKQLYELQYHQPLVLFFIMFVLSGSTVFLCAWLMDKAGGVAKSRAILIGSILIAAAFFSINGIDYRQWQMTPIIQQAMESPEVNYQPAYWDFCKVIAIPRALAGGMIGLYLSAGLCSTAASVMLAMQAYRRRPFFDQEHPTQGDPHGRTTP